MWLQSDLKSPVAHWTDSSMEIYASIVAFMEQGGRVLFLIALLIFFMWALIFERIFYFRTEHQGNVEAFTQYWLNRTDHMSWAAGQIKLMLLSQMNIKMAGSMGVIIACVALCPLLGLLGTVTGMISVFDAMSTQGGNARSMAAGVSMATIPTMAGMVGSLSGLFAVTYLQRLIESKTADFESHLAE